MYVCVFVLGLCFSVLYFCRTTAHAGGAILRNSSGNRARAKERAWVTGDSALYLSHNLNFFRSEQCPRVSTKHFTRMSLHVVHVERVGQMLARKWKWRHFFHKSAKSFTLNTKHTQADAHKYNTTLYIFCRAITYVLKGYNWILCWAHFFKKKKKILFWYQDPEACSVLKGLPVNNTRFKKRKKFKNRFYRIAVLRWLCILHSLLNNVLIEKKIKRKLTFLNF